MEYAIMEDHESMRYYCVPYEDANRWTEECEVCGGSDMFVSRFSTSEDVSQVMNLLLDYGLFGAIEEVLLCFDDKSTNEIALACLENYKYEIEAELKQVNKVITTVRGME